LLPNTINYLARQCIDFEIPDGVYLARQWRTNVLTLRYLMEFIWRANVLTLRYLIEFIWHANVSTLRYLKRQKRVVGTKLDINVVLLLLLFFNLSYFILFYFIFFCIFFFVY